MTEFFIFVASVLTALLIGAVVRHLTGFASQKHSEYAGNSPTLVLPRDLAGEMVCEGLIFGPTGRVTSRFRADFTITWDGPEGIMAEHFHYDDGTTQEREWRLTVAPDGSLRTEADDVIGTGTGRVEGNALGLRYKIRLPVENGGHVLDAVDWMYLNDNGTILNRSQFRKYGIKVAELFCTMRSKENSDA